MPPRSSPHRPPARLGRFALCGLACVLGACSSLPTQAPALPAFASLPAGYGSSLGGTVAIDAQWWRRFGDAGLDAAVEATLTANTDLAAARANLQRARALRQAAQGSLLPSLQVSGSAQRVEPAAASSRGANLFQAGFDAAWEPDLFGANAHQLAALRADEQASARSLEQARVTLAAEAAADVVQLRGTLARAALAAENLAAQRETLQITQWRQQAGLTTSLEVEQAASAVEQTSAQIPALHAGAAQLRHALAALMGRTPDALPPPLQAEPAGSANAAGAVLPAPPQDWASSVPAALLRQRADLAQAEAQMRAAAERVAVADAQRKPQIALRASLAWSGLTLAGLGGTQAVSTLVASASQSLFDGGQRDAQLAAQLAAFEASVASYRGRVLGALQEVEDAFAALAGARERLAALQRAEAAASNAALLASQRHAAGIADFQTVLDTQRSRLAVQDSRASAQTDWVTAHIRLVKALGGGWQAAPSPSP